MRREEKWFHCSLVALILVIMFLVGTMSHCLINADEIMSVKEFLVQHPDIKIELNGYGQNFDKYTPSKTLHRAFDHSYGDILFIIIGEDRFEMVLKNDWQRIGNTDYSVAYEQGQLFFRVAQPKQQLKQQTKQKEATAMSLSLGTWIFLIIVMVIVAKIAHRISLKTIFRPTKKSIIHVKKEWEES